MRQFSAHRPAWRIIGKSFFFLRTWASQYKRWCVCFCVCYRTNGSGLYGVYKTRGGECSIKLNENRTQKGRFVQSSVLGCFVWCLHNAKHRCIDCNSRDLWTPLTEIRHTGFAADRRIFSFTWIPGSRRMTSLANKLRPQLQDDWHIATRNVLRNKRTTSLCEIVRIYLTEWRKLYRFYCRLLRFLDRNDSPCLYAFDAKWIHCAKNILANPSANTT